MKVRVYLDTSVFSAYIDERTPDRQKYTRELWERLPEFEVTTSELAREELADVVSAERRDRLLALLEGIVVHAITAEMRAVAAQYVHQGVFTVVMTDDALHVAAASLTRQDILLSWNFKHLVNRRRRAWIAPANIALGLPTPEILAPPEL